MPSTPRRRRSHERTVSATVAVALLGLVTCLAIAVACVAALQTNTARAALRARGREHDQSVELAKQMEATSRLAGDVAHDVTDLLTAIAGHAELLIARLDPSGTSIQDAHEIRHAALRAAQLTRQLRTLTGEPYMSTDVIDVSAVTTRTITSLQPLAPPLAAARVMAAVMVVEDEPQVRELIRLVLVRAGHEVVAVAGPHVALAALNRQPAISLMLVDVVMPEMDGYDLAVEARKVSPGVHVVFMSAFARDGTRHPEGDGFLAKPFTVESLTGIVEKALSR